MIRHYGSQLVEVSCERQGSGTGYEPGMVAKVRFQKRCGTISQDFVREVLRPTNCKAADDPEACYARIDEMFVARLKERYRHADRGWIDNHCRGYPAACSTLQDYELLYLESHNERVFTAWMASKADLDARQAQAQAEQRAKRRYRAVAVAAVLAASN